MKKGILFIGAITLCTNVIYRAQAKVISCINGLREDKATICEKCGDNCNWSYDDSSKHLEVFGKGNMNDYLNGSYFPWGNFHIESLNVSGIEKLGRNAFHAHPELKRVDLAASITNLEPGAFQDAGVEIIAVTDQINNIGFWSFLKNPLNNIMCIGEIKKCEEVKSMMKEASAVFSDDKFNIIGCPQGKVIYKGQCLDEYPFAKKHYTPAEAAQWLNEDNNTITITFKKQ